jgi:hypothetical protein
MSEDNHDREMHAWADEAQKWRALAQEAGKALVEHTRYIDRMLDPALDAVLGKLMAAELLEVGDE